MDSDDEGGSRRRVIAAHLKELKVKLIIQQNL